MPVSVAANVPEMILFSGTSHPELAQKVATCLGVTLGKIHIERFPDNETFVQIKESVRGVDTFVIQSVSLDPNNYLMELLIIVDALKRASAKSICAVLPYFGYSRQDRRDKPRVPITARLIADLLSAAGVNSVLTMDLHTGQVQGFFDLPVDNLQARPVLANALKEFADTKNIVVVAPDVGSVKLARTFASQLGVDFAIVDKHRFTSTEVEVVTLIGEVNGKDVLLADDMASTGGTLVSAAKACQEKGAKRIFAAITHGIFVGDAVSKVQQSPIEALFMTDTVPYSDRLAGFTKLHTVSVAPIFAEAIHRFSSKESISSLSELTGSVPTLSH